MILVGIDDTDTLDDPGTNQLARHLVRSLGHIARGRVITRHQLLEDPRVPCTRKNGCAGIEFELCDGATVDELTVAIREIMVPWCPRGSDPGLCVATTPITQAIVAFGRACQERLVTQLEARQLASSCGVYLEGLGGTEDGVIGALAAVGLVNTRDDGRVVFLGSSAIDHFDITGAHPIDVLLACGVDEVRLRTNNSPINAGTVDVGKRLRPNYRGGRVVLYVSPQGVSAHDGPACEWLAERVV